jgi:hypothetical protein
MKQLILGLFALLALALPQAAHAQTFTAKHAYTAKFLCGGTQGAEQGLGVVGGHYNTIINVHAVEERTSMAFRATALRTDLDTDTGYPSGFSIRWSFDRDGGVGIVCNYIKSLLGVQESEGFIEGFVTLYSDRPLDVVDVLTGQQSESIPSVMEVLPVPESGGKMKVDAPQPG